MTQIPLTFETRHARTRMAMRDFYLSRDLFLHEMLRRRGLGLPFALYRAPDGNDVDCWLTPIDLRRHTLVLGGTGSGKSSLLEAMAISHFRRRQGLALIDLHGDLFNRTAAWALHHRVPNLVLLDFTQPDVLPGWNALAPIDGVDSGRHVDLLVGVLKRLYASETAASWAWGVKVEELFRYGLSACIESQYPATLVDLRRFFLAPGLRREILATASSETQAYFRTRFGAREEMYVSAVLNKLDPFLSSAAVRRFLGQAESTFDPFRLVDEGGTLLINLAKGYLPEAEVVGHLLTNVLKIAALRRESQRPESRVPFSVILDEAHNLASSDSGLDGLISAALKYRVFVTIAAQGLSLFPARFRALVLGNTGRQYFFRLPYSEARLLAHDLFEPTGNVRRERVRSYDSIEDPYLTPTEEIAARTKELSNLPTGSCYWAMTGRRFRGRRIKVKAPATLPIHSGELRNRIRQAMVARAGGR